MGKNAEHQHVFSQFKTHFPEFMRPKGGIKNLSKRVLHIFFGTNP
jgi:hypothetical protein